MPTVHFNWDQAAAQLAGGVTRNDWQPFPGTAMSFTYAYRSTGDEPPVPPGLSPEDWIVGGLPDGAEGFSRFTAAQMAVMEVALDLIESVANVTFNRVGAGTSGEGAYSNDAQLLLGNFNAGPLANQVSGLGYYYYWWFGSSPTDPGTTFIRASKAFFDISDDYANNPSLTNGGLWLYLHEVLHTISLEHPGMYDATDGGPITYANDAEYIEDTVQYTAMSYFSEQHTGANYGVHAPMTPMLHDIAALQLLYGANMTTRTGDSVYGFNSNTGLDSFTFTNADDARVFTIWDAGGEDTLDFSGFSTNSELDLREEQFSSGGVFSPGNLMVNNIAIARGAVIENAIGGSGADTLIGNSAANQLTGNGGADSVDGGGGNDTLNGGAGNDVLRGGFGNDAMAGGLGDDYYYAEHAGDTITELAGQGTDTVETALANYVMVAHTENLILAGSANINATGTSGANVMSGNSGANTLIGGLGNDVLQGLGGKDLLTGGGGLDRFVFTSLTDSAVAFAGREAINTFAHGDKIDLSAIDANVNVAGDQAFTWSPGGLTGVAGQLYVQQNAARSWTVWADVNGDAVADFALNIYGAPALNNGIFAWDFIL